MTQEETDINDLAKAVDDAMPKKGLVRVSPSYGICVYVPLKRKDGTIDMQAVELLCGIDSVPGERSLRITSTFIAIAEQNSMDKSQLAKELAQFARQIHSANDSKQPIQGAEAMNIAKREAEKLPIRANLYKKADLRNNVITLEGAKDIAEAAYIAGRTAEPTEAEIKAAVRAMHYRYAADWESDEARARYILEAARKAVTE